MNLITLEKGPQFNWSYKFICGEETSEKEFVRQLNQAEGIWLQSGCHLNHLTYSMAHDIYDHCTQFSDGFVCFFQWSS